ncbi:MAG: hypothetical protein PF693_21580 [Spirochaetia bacterium]|jgi:hypothetical protein|nr:hypothetical protein [Spirochaetia bacterium]
MEIAGFLVYGVFFVLVFLGKFAIDYIEERLLCPCMVKVPFSLLALGVIFYNYFYQGIQYDALIWIPFIAALLIGNFLIGNISSKFYVLEYVGIGVFFSIFVYTIGALVYFYGIPDVQVLVVYTGVFGLYFLTTFSLLGLKLKEVWHEYLYILGAFVMFIFSIQEDIGMAAPIGACLFLYSEVIRQISRFKDDDVIVDYQATAVYLAAIAILTIPKFIF